MRTSRSSSASVAEIPQSIAAATRKNSVCTGSCAWAPTKRIPCASECPEASDMDNAVNASGMASSTSCCSRRRSKVSRAAPTPNGATSPKTKPMGDNDVTASKTLQIPLDSSRNARRAALSSIASPRRSAGISDATSGQSLSAGRFPPTHGAVSPPSIRASGAPAPPAASAAHEALPHTPSRQKARQPLRRGHSDLHSSTSSCVSVPNRKPSAINGGSRSSVQVRSAASNVT